MKKQRTYNLYAWWTWVRQYPERRRRTNRKLQALMEEYALLGYVLVGKIRHLLQGLTPDLVQAQVSSAVQIRKQRRGWRVKRFPEIAISVTYRGNVNHEGIRDCARVEVRDFLVASSVPVVIKFNLK